MSDVLEQRISTAFAAKYLGTTRRHIEKLVAAGALTAVDVRMPGAKRSRLSVTLSSVRSFIEKREIKSRTTRTENRETHQSGRSDRVHVARSTT